MPRSVANLLLLVAGLLWGGGFVAQETAMDDIGPFLFVAMRFVLAALAVAPLAYWESRRLGGGPALTWMDLRQILVVGTLFFTAMILQQVGLLTTTVTNAGMLTGLYVVMVPLIAFVALRQRQPRLIWPCAIGATIGIWLLGGGGLSQFTIGDVLVIIGAVFAALHVIALGDLATRTRRPLAAAVGQFAVAAALALVAFAIVRGLDWSGEPPVETSTLVQALPEILYASFVAGAVAFTLMAVCQQYTSAAEAAVLMASEALFAALGGAILLGERLDVLGYAGCAILFCAIIVTSFASAQEIQPQEAKSGNL